MKYEDKIAKAAATPIMKPDNLAFLRFRENKLVSARKSPPFTFNPNGKITQFLRLAFWISVIHLFSPLTLIPAASAGVLPSKLVCGLT